MEKPCEPIEGTSAPETGAAARPRWGKVSRSKHDRGFLKGPRSRWADTMGLARIARDYVKGFRALHTVGPCVTVFGSARFDEDHRYYALARETGASLARAGFTVMTGGGPGIMEAANRGAWETGGLSVGVNIDLPFEQRPNDFLDRWLTLDYFHVRKVMLVKYSYAFIAMPGGLGTMDEIYETNTLIQTGKIADFPVVMMGGDFWEPLLRFMRDTMVHEGTIDAADIDRIKVTDSPEEAANCILHTVVKRFGLHWEATAGPRRERDISA